MALRIPEILGFELHHHASSVPDLHQSPTTRDLRVLRLPFRPTLHFPSFSSFCYFLLYSFLLFWWRLIMTPP